jgi:Divergent InlB B-repeat domain
MGDRRWLLAAFIAAASIGAAIPTAALAAETTLQIVPVGLGSVAVSPDPKAVADPDGNPLPDVVSEVDGVRDDIKSGSRILTYDAGTRVTLTAIGGPDTGDGPATRLYRWSDDRCPPGPQCVLTVDPEPESIAAIFTPQRVSVWLNGTGTVSAPGLTGTELPPACAADDGFDRCIGDYEVGTPVTLLADSPVAPTWLTSIQDRPSLVLCDAISPDGKSCAVTADRPRWASVGFGFNPVDQIPPEVSVRFRVLKSGSGSGTVRSQTLECGGRCATDRTFGDSETLVAVPDGGSHFEHWRAACGTDPTCRLAVGPVTAVTAVFERNSASSQAPATSPSPAPGPSPRPRGGLTARVVKLNVRGHGRRRAILIRLEVSAGASVRALLVRGHRRVASHHWRLSPGSSLLRIKVPTRARRGAYSVRLTVSGAGQTKRINVRVRLRR